MCYWYLYQICKGCSFRGKEGITITDSLQKVLDNSKAEDQTKYR